MISIIILITCSIKFALGLEGTREALFLRSQGLASRTGVSSDLLQHAAAETHTESEALRSRTLRGAEMIPGLSAWDLIQKEERREADRDTLKGEDEEQQEEGKSSWQGYRVYKDEHVDQKETPLQGQLLEDTKEEQHDSIDTDDLLDQYRNDEFEYDGDVASDYEDSGLQASLDAVSRRLAKVERAVRGHSRQLDHLRSIVDTAESLQNRQDATHESEPRNEIDDLKLMVSDLAHGVKLLKSQQSSTLADLSARVMSLVSSGQRDARYEAPLQRDEGEYYRADAPMLRVPAQTNSTHTALSPERVPRRLFEAPQS
eukprot:CAMPEP_0194481160 /NCGR_PEP_ID=MMETSP0253-20130528/3712_1 /TAXON_ID=2966 /ORGANISM="Noctiluca scintillans" /LENGTH=314 /DNA_ID=CAMNT_0039320627 /DNA_START=67 /DNA_END=1011 /DNA_ORIENTATION=+